MKWSRVTLPTIVTNSFTTTEARDRKACSAKMNGSRLSLGGPGGVSEGQITTGIDGFAVNHGIIAVCTKVGAADFSDIFFRSLLYFGVRLARHRTPQQLNGLR